MLTANVATAKNELSRLLRRVKRGERVIITERNHPIAQLQPFSATEGDAPSPGLAALYEAGVLTPPASAGLDVAAFLALPEATLPEGHALSAAILAEREEGR
ncbi:MAG: type II toxin-antitoxin system prevent-host-death family antitoxin [Verrucomicrobia bacterium]|nr:type II toxin-antitoxin system prevent-host-death family antitoxin [Verrucomicrobiota bacterium]